jgi:hypothetical protein
MNDLETTLVESLRARADAIDPANLSYPVWRPDAIASATSLDTAQRGGRRWLMPAVAAVAVVLAVVATVTVGSQAGHRSRLTEPGTSVGNTGFIGYRWRLVQIRHDDVVTDVPSSLDASVLFAADRSILIDDTVNVSSGPFTLVPGGYRIGDLAQTLVGYGGLDPVRRSVIEAQAALGRPGTVLASVSSPPGVPGVTQLRLTPLSAAGFSLLFDRDGPANPFPTASGTAGPQSTSS